MTAQSPSALAKEWGCSEQGIRHAINKGRLRAFRLGGKLLRIKEEDAEAFRATHGIPYGRTRDVTVIYFIRCEDFVKIGLAKDENKRLADMQVGNPFPLDLLFTEPGGFKHEAALHRRFAEYRSAGEWFRIEGALAEYIAGQQG